MALHRHSVAFAAIVLLLAVVLVVDVSAKDNNPNRPKVKRSLSFRPPFVPRNGVQGWSVGAQAAIQKDFVRLTQQKQSQSGYMWTEKFAKMKDWEALIEFRITGERNIGGDGFAFWYTDGPNMVGNVFGAMDYWKGLGVFVDTFDNDGKGASPLITATVNDGTQSYIASDDGLSQAIGSCSFPVRNLPRTSFLRIRYQNQRLSVQFARQPGDVFEKCLEVNNVVLDVNMHFGLSAHTGDVADNHDIYSLIVKDLTPENADLDAVHRKYIEKLEEGVKSHNADVSTPELFQHAVLAALRQLQSSQNNVELTQVCQFLVFCSPRVLAICVHSQLIFLRHVPMIPLTLISLLYLFFPTSLSYFSCR